MTNVDKLKQIGIIGVVRQRLGAANQNDESFDESINQIDNDRIVREWAIWYLGTDGWWVRMKAVYDKLENTSKSQK